MRYRGPMERAYGVALALAALVALGCTEEPSDETPAGAVRLFLDAMSRSDRDPAALREAYGLLARPARRGLSERARLAESLGGRDIQPWDMIAQGRYRQAITPAPGSRGMRESIEGSRATVTVMDERGQRRAEVPLVREDGGWRIELELPDARPEPEEEL